MTRGWLVAALCVHVLSTITQKGSATNSAFPNFPTIDEPRVVAGNRYNPPNVITNAASAAPIKITHLRVRSEIALRYARTAIISNVYNPSKRPQEATFHVLLPETAFITGFTMSIGKETYEAYVKEKEKAQQIYNDAVAKGVSAAHVATKARDSNHFTIKFNLEGRSNATYRLRYEEFLVRRNGVYNHAINLLPGALVPTMDVVIHIKESQKISLLRVPELRTGNEVDATEKDAQNSKAVVKRGKHEQEATITFTPDLAEQTRLAEIYAEKIKQSGDPDSSNIGYNSAEDENETEGLLGQFVVQYDVEQPKNGEILVNDGYFVHFFAPTSLPPLSKHAVFVLDTSGSMYGTKIDQLRKAMVAILSELNPSDYFSIIEFNTNIKVHDLLDEDEDVHDSLPIYQSLSYTPKKLVPPALASPENIASAKTIVSRFIATGGTNIYQALDVALNVVQNGIHVKTHIDTANTSVEYNNGINATGHNENDLEPIILFLTDGGPNVYEYDTDRIISYISEKNYGSKKQASIYSLAFGDAANRVFLRKLSLRNEGFMRQIYEAGDAALQLRDFYRQMSSPLLADVKFLYPRRQIKEGSVSNSEFRTINDGSEVAVVGRIAENVNEITPQVLGLRAEGDGRGRKPYEVNPKVPVMQAKDEHLPLERLWAYLTIKQLLDKSDAGDGSQSDTEDSPEKKALDIALKYSFVTPLTSLVVVRLNKTDAVEAVNAETVDDPRYLPYILEKPSPSELTFKITSTGNRVSLTSPDGPFLFAVSKKRIITSGGDFSLHRTNSYSSGSSSTGYGVSQSSGYSSNSNAQGFTVATYSPYNYDELREVYHLEGYEWALSYINYDALVLDVSGQIVLKLSKDVNPPKSSIGDDECWPGEPVGSERAGLLCVYLTRCFAARNYTLSQYRDRFCGVLEGWLTIDINPSKKLLSKQDTGGARSRSVEVHARDLCPAVDDYRLIKIDKEKEEETEEQTGREIPWMLYAGVCCPRTEIDKIPTTTTSTTVTAAVKI